MRGHKRLLGALFAFMATLAVAFSATGLAYAYPYTVRVFPGNRGKLTADPVSVKVEKGGHVNLFDFARADTSDSKYVQIGFRLSGTDKLLGNGVVNGITEDMDYVVAYGVEGETVAYTLKFVEYGTGRELASPKTYYGRIGDKPVAAYEYIEGYRPLYLTITGTLKENEEDNVWTFEYVRLAEGETVETSTTTTNTTVTNNPGNETVNNETTYEPGTTTTTTRTETVPGTTTTEPGTTTDGGTTRGGTTTTTTAPTTTGGTTTTTPAGTGTTTTTVVPIVTGGTTPSAPATTTTTTTTTTPEPSASPAPAGAGGGDASAPAGDAAGAGAATASGASEGAAAPESAPATREILDMDTPLAGPEGDGNSLANGGGNATQASSRVNPLAILGVLLALGIACALFYFFFWKRKKESENEQESEE